MAFLYSIEPELLNKITY
eukprot:UN20261